MTQSLYTLKQISEITGKTNTSLFKFIKNNAKVIGRHSYKNGRFVKYDETALQMFIDKFGRVCKIDDFHDEQTNDASDVKNERKIETFEEQIALLKKERDELITKLESKEKDCAEWRFQAGQALNALSKEQDHVYILEKKLAGFLPANHSNSENNEIIDKTIENQMKRKLSWKEKIKMLFGYKSKIH